MPTTRENIAEIHRRNPKYSPTEILGFLNEVNQRCVENELDQFLFLNGSGVPPYLSTLAATYVYNCPANCRKTWMVCVDFQEGFDYTSYYYPTRMLESITAGETEWCGHKYFKLPYITQKDALPSNDQLAQVTFGGLHDPGTTIDKYIHFYWILANQLTTLDDELQIPDNLHFNIRRAISAYMATEDYGESGADDQMIEKCVKIVKDKLSRGAKGRIGQTKFNIVDRDFY
jgi:hypothetical protein